LITGLSFDLAIDEIAVQNLDDTEWLWEEPDLKYDAPITADELQQSRQAEFDNLMAFGVLEYVPESRFKEVDGAIWISSRWEDIRKDSGQVRSRWVLQEFARKAGEG
jgi:hypothetical protein